MKRVLIQAARLLPERWQRASLRVQAPVHRRQGQTHRVSARVAGREVWFESADLPLAPSMEGFASMFLAVAFHRGARLRLCGAVDAGWMQNTGGLTGVYKRWWPHLEGPVVDAPDRSGPRGARQPGSLLFFTGGVDSFYSLLRGPAVDALVYVHGFDAPLDDHARMLRLDQGLRQVARQTGHRAVWIRTNLRRHPRFRQVHWELTHGGALAGTAHLLADSFGSAVVSSSDTGAGLDDVPWGTHQETDKLYSSANMAIRHAGESVYRLDKLRALAGEPLVRQHLRVCWENRTREMNCCLCEKCLRTMVFLAGVGELENFPAFAHGRGDLHARIDALPRIENKYIQLYWADVLPLALPPDVRAAVQGVLARSGWHPGRVARENRSGA